MKPRGPCSLSAPLLPWLFLLASSFTSADWTVILKVASIGLLAVLGFRVNRLLGTALSFGALGDFLLGVHRLGDR